MAQLQNGEYCVLNTDELQADGGLATGITNGAKDNPNTYNVYVEGGFVKIQNKVGNNKSIAAGVITV